VGFPGGWVDSIEVLDCHSSLSKPGSPLRRRERGEIFSFVIQSRQRRDWITRLSPSGIDSDCVRPLSGCKRGFFWHKKDFLFGGLSPPNKKMTSWRSLRLCGENPNLDKTEFWLSLTPLPREFGFHFLYQFSCLK